MSKAITIAANVRKPDPVQPRGMEGMTRTTIEMCRKCIYSISLDSGSHTPACYYLIRTGKDRACPIGWCDKYEKGKRKRNECKINMKNNMAFSVRKTYEV